LSDERRHNKVPVAVRPAAGADAAVEPSVHKLKLLDAQSLLRSYEWGLDRAKQWGGPAAIEAAEKGILAMQERIVNLQKEEVDPETHPVVHNSDPSEWTASDFK